MRIVDSGNRRATGDAPPGKVGGFGRAFLALAAAAVGCIPGQSVVGRPAPVMAEGEQRGSFGLGGVIFDRESAERDLTAGIFYPYLSYAQGVGRGFDYEVGGWVLGDEGGNAGVGHLAILLRKQILGEPYVMDAENELRTRPLDLSVEMGGSISGAVGGSTAGGWGDVHLGANASVPLPWGATPYVSYRYHWGGFDGALEVQMLFVGVEFTRTDWGARVCVEIFHGYPPDYDRESIWRTWGCNILYRTYSF